MALRGFGIGIHQEADWAVRLPRQREVARIVEPDPVHLPVPEQALAQALESSDSAEAAQRGVQGDATLSARPFLQVVSDLYERWLMDGNVWDQLKTVWERLKDG